MRAATSSPGTLRPCSMLNRNEVASPPAASDNLLYDSPCESLSVRIRSATGSSATGGVVAPRGVVVMRPSYRVLSWDANSSGECLRPAPTACEGPYPSLDSAPSPSARFREGDPL